MLAIAFVPARGERIERTSMLQTGLARAMLRRSPQCNPTHAGGRLRSRAPTRSTPTRTRKKAASRTSYPFDPSHCCRSTHSPPMPS
eukprot:6206806-Pyramimonas_sp.AAC.1